MGHPARKSIDSRTSKSEGKMTEDPESERGQPRIHVRLANLPDSLSIYRDEFPAPFFFHVFSPSLSSLAQHQYTTPQSSLLNSQLPSTILDMKTRSSCG